MNHLSLFTGIMGIDYAAHLCGIQTIACCEKEQFPQRVIRKHMPDVPIIEDVREITKERLSELGIEPGTIDLISAGYPCQPFSHAGKREGEKDDRHLWPEVKRILEDVRPRWFLGENVAGHVTLGLDDVLDDLARTGYTAQAFLVPASAIGASHKRERVFIVAHPASKGLPQRRQPGLPTAGEKTTAGMEPEPELCGEALAHSPSKRCGEAREHLRRSEEWASCSDIMGNADSFQPQGKQSIRITALDRRSPKGKHQGAGHGAGEQRPTQSGVGGDFNGLPAWLDGDINPLDALHEIIASVPHPALLGMPQHDWEPPRVATGVKNRAARLKALGNAVVPWQVYPILMAIKIIHESMSEDSE